eukprot:TRINITY_DN5459_c0_g1_i2.p1 TRINITY_DN5459_c0_g1~~TRINITY_DN5459_c0_g1_i2.p1  ORF type:complete len:332 (+),score=91.58 TRINITY_DN5459_c0_g1_i2:9-1004(+)
MQAHAHPALLMLDDAAVRPCLRDPAEVTACMEQVLAAFSAPGGGVLQPDRTVMSVSGSDGGLLFVMPGYVPGFPTGLGIKLVTLYPHNDKLGLASHRALVTVFDSRTGQPAAQMDGDYITALRTACVSAVATKHLAAPTAKILAVLGTGTQARTHIEAVRLVRDFAEIRLWGRTLAKARALAAELAAAGITVRVCAEAAECVQGADVICTVTSATTPVLFGRWVKPGAHVNAVGACHPTWREMDDALMGSAAVVADSRTAAAKESGDIIQTKAPVVAELGEVAAPGFSAARKAELQQRTTVFKSLGMAVEDIATAHLVLTKHTAAAQRGRL